LEKFSIFIEKIDSGNTNDSKNIYNDIKDTNIKKNLFGGK